MVINKIKLIKLAVTVLGFAYSGAAQAIPGNTSCPTGQSIQSTLGTGAKWAMCWEARAEEGIVLSNIRYQAPEQSERRVLGEMSLSQIQRNYDDGSPTQYIVTERGLKSVAGKKVLCQNTKDIGIIYKYLTAQAVNGKVLSLMSASQVGNQSYIQEWFENWPKRHVG